MGDVPLSASAGFQIPAEPTAGHAFIMAPATRAQRVSNNNTQRMPPDWDSHCDAADAMTVAKLLAAQSITSKSASAVLIGALYPG